MRDATSATSSTQEVSLRESAVELSELTGWHVFPIGGAGGKTPLWRRDDGGGRWGATSDPDELHRCWPAGATGVGLACGESGIVAVDFDPPPGDPDW
jgi:hypothetical protein